MTSRNNTKQYGKNLATPIKTILTQSGPSGTTRLRPDPRLPRNFEKATLKKNKPSKETKTRVQQWHSSVSSSSSVASSLTSCTDATDIINTFVYVKDPVYVWLPAMARAKSYEDHTAESTEVTITLPEDWSETTMLYNESTIKELEYNIKSNKKKGRENITSPQHGEKPNCRSMDESQKNKKIFNYDSSKTTKATIGKSKKHEIGTIRKIDLKDYLNGELPVQNIERKKNRSSISHTSKMSTNTIINARDMADLSYLHEAAILYNLKLRHSIMKPYTRVNDIMVAVNPFLWIDGLYSTNNQELYAKHLIWDVRDVDNESTSTKNRGNKLISNSSILSVSNLGDDSSINSERSGIASLRKSDSQTAKHQPMTHGSFYSKLGLEPHVFETASLAYRGLASEQQNQTILVSGESGAGKTETVKIVMTHLATVERTRPFYLPNHNVSEGVTDVREIAEESGGVVRRVLESNPVFEAFGNAKTCRNDNSSRFGRFTQLQFDVENPSDTVQFGRNSMPNCVLAGSTCSTYLLEKSRVVSHAAEERTYHIFYQLLAAPEDEKADIWFWLAGTTHESFNYIGTPTTTRIDGHSDADAWEHTIEALKVFGFEGESYQDLMQALCIVLQLGNLVFEAETSEGEEGAVITSVDELDKLSTLMGVQRDDIIRAMTIRVNKIRGEEVTVKLSPSEAKDGCDALAKEVYARIFEVLVRQINEYTSVSGSQMKGVYPAGKVFGTISLLDIFGFEKFDTNRFEQMCINYANERLQQKYVLDNFNNVQEEYTAEGIELFDFSIVDNSDVIRLYEGDMTDNTRKLGLISTLNEECVRPRGTDDAFVQKAKQLLGYSSRLLSDKLHNRFEFGIRHFAGCVTYDSTQFLQSNMDRIPLDLMACACASTNGLIQKEFTELAAVGTKVKSKSSKQTVLSKFRSQLNDLMEAVELTRTRYIRCIKPNTRMLPHVFDHQESMNQLLSAGLVTAITISRETFPNRLHYDVVWERFQCLYQQPVDNSSAMKKSLDLSLHGSRESKHETKLRANVEGMLECLLVQPFTRADGVRVPSFACGKTKVYFRTGALESLETERLEYYYEYATTIQSWFRCLSMRLKYCEMKSAAVEVQRMVRGMVVRNDCVMMEESALMIECWWRAMVSRIQLKRLKSCVRLQSCWRMYVLRAKFLSYRASLEATSIDATSIDNDDCCETVSSVNTSRNEKLASIVESKRSELDKDLILCLRREAASLREENLLLSSDLKELEEDKLGLISHAQLLEAREQTIMNHTQQLLKNNISLQKDISNVKAENLELRRRMKKHEEDRLEEVNTMKTSFNAMLTQMDSELHTLKQKKISDPDKENRMYSKISRQLEMEREEHLLEVNTLKEKLQKSQDTHKNYMERLTDALEVSHSLREEEIEKLSLQLKKITAEKNAEIRRLRDKLNYHFQ